MNTLDTLDTLKQAIEALEIAREMLEQADCSTGYCYCGSLFDGHTIGDGHSPVDEGVYFQSKAIDKSKVAITSLKQAIADMEAQEPKCVAIVEVFGKDWRLEYMSLPVGRHKLYAQQYLYTHPQPKAEQDKEVLGFNGWGFPIEHPPEPEGGENK